MDKDRFASCFGFENYEEMLGLTTTVIKDGECHWNITNLPWERFLVWDNTELGDDRVEVFLDREDAEKYLDLLYNHKTGKNAIH